MEEVREVTQALKEEKERHQLEEATFHEVSKKATADIQSLNFYYRRRAGQIDNILSKLSSQHDDT
jgi:hypothetical protein